MVILKTLQQAQDFALELGKEENEVEILNQETEEKVAERKRIQ